MRIFLLVLFALCGCGPYDGVESNFTVAGERAPVWVTKQVGIKKATYVVQMTLRTSGKVDAVILDGAERNRVVFRATGQYGGEILAFTDDTRAYPAYIEITIDGVGEIYEHKASGPYLYVVDDPRGKSAGGTAR